MALNRGAPPPPAGAGAPGPPEQQPSWVPSIGNRAIPARPPAQAAVFGVCVLTMAMVASAAGHPVMAIPAAMALAAGIALGLATSAHRIVAHFAGAAMALIAMVATGGLIGVLAATTGMLIPPISVVLVGCFVLGLDWRNAARLRVLPFLTGFFVVPVVGLERGWAYPAALLWLAVSVAALWLLQDDEQADLPRPTPLAPVAPERPSGVRSLDVVGTLGIALLLGVTAAFLLGRPSCSLSGKPDPPNQLPSEPFDPPSGDPFSGDGSGRPAQPGEVPPDYRSGSEAGPGDRPEVGSAGGERQVQVDESGNRYVEDPATGERYEVVERDGNDVVVDGDGNVVAELDDRGVVASGEGDAQRYQVDEDGRYFVEGDDGERYHLGTDGDGNPVLRDGQGTVVARGGPSDDHLVIRDPDGRVLVPDSDGDGEIPVPNGGVRSALPGSDDATYRVEDDRLIATDDDGTTRTYDRAPGGERRVRVDKPGEAPRVFVYEEGSGRDLTVLEYDGDGNFVARYRYDPDGVIVDGSPGPGGQGSGGRVGTGDGSASGSGGQAVGGEGGDQPTSADQSDGAGGGSVLPWVLGALVVAAAIGFGAWWWRRRPDPPIRPR